MALVESAKNVADNLRAYALALAASDIEAALRVAHSYGYFLWNNFIGVFSDCKFEKTLADCLTALLTGKSKQGTFDTLHLMTRAVVFGGHSRAVERLLAGKLGDGLATLDKLPTPVLEHLGQDIKVFDGIREESGAATISAILETGLKFRNIILHIDPDDIYSAVAAILLARSGVKVFMYNHCDFAFSFGYGAAEKVFEITKYGWVRGVARGIEHKQTFVGIPTPYFALRQEGRTGKQPRQILMAGSANKFFPWGSYSVPAFINQIHKEGIGRSGLGITICGPTGRERFWRSLNRNARHQVEFLRPRPHAEYLRLLSNFDLYVDSFPIGNGTGFTESVMHGIPSFGLDLLSGNSHADVLRSRSVPALINAIANYIGNKEAARRELLQVREQVMREQSVDVCIGRILSAMEGQARVTLPNGFASMRCMEDFLEEHWKWKNRINMDSSMLRGLDLKQKTEVGSTLRVLGLTPRRAKFISPCECGYEGHEKPH